MIVGLLRNKIEARLTSHERDLKIPGIPRRYISVVRNACQIASSSIFAVSSPQMDFVNQKKMGQVRAEGLQARRHAEAERLVSAGKVDDDSELELTLRPKRLAEFIGQSKAKEQLAIALEAAKSRGEALDHVLLFGPPGLGKTTLATIIANELEVGYQQTSGPALQIQGDLTAILTNLREKQVL